ncbi:MAG: sulfur carrier protein ThiS [Verrucomicrobiota bacterium]
MANDDRVRIFLNGTERAVAAGLTVLELLRELGLESVPVLVEWNGTALFPREFGDTRVEAGGRMEIIRIVAGG